MNEYIEDNTALREEIARAHAVLDKAGIGEPGLRFSERIKMLVKRERRIHADLTAALALIETGARERERLRHVCERVADFLETEKELEVSDYLAACGRDFVQHLRAALETEEPPE